jgi:hypothetical protein
MRRTKNGDLSNFFSVYRIGDSRTRSDPENRVGDQNIGMPGRPVTSGLKVPGDPGHLRARTRTLGEFPRHFSFKMSFICTTRDK